MASATPAGSEAGGASSKPAVAPKPKIVSQSDLQGDPSRTTYKRLSDDMELGVYRSYVAIMPEKRDDPITYEYRFEKGAVKSGDFIVPVYIDCSVMKDESTGLIICRQCKRPQIAPDNRIEHTDLCACRPVRGGSRKRRKSRKARKSRTITIHH
jgi:hypothetical protein